MALPAYNKANRKKSFSFETLPKNAYVVKIVSAKEDVRSDTGGPCVKIAFDIAEGDYKGFYDKQYKQMKANSEDASWPYDAVFSLTVPTDTTPDYIRENYDTFFADLEDSNDGFVFDGNTKKLTNKLIGGKFRIKQTEKNGTVQDHTELYWTCVAEDVRQGKAGKLPNDKLIGSAPKATASKTDDDGFMNIADDSPEELPF